MTAGGSDRPGLGSDDLLDELDAWDKTFDALHDEEGLLAGAAAAVAATPVPPAPVPPAPVPPDPEPMGPAEGAGFADSDDDVTRSVPVPTAPPPAVTVVAPRPERRTTPPPPPRTRPHTTPPPPMVEPRRPPAPRPVIAARPAVPVVVKPPVLASELDETDFSDLGFSGPPSALGSLLGQPPPLPPLEDASEPSFDDDEVLTSAVRPGAVMGESPAELADDPFAPSGDELEELRRQSHGAGGGDVTRIAQVSPEMFDVDDTMDRGAARRAAAAVADDFSDPGRDPSDDTFDRANRTQIVDPNDALLAEAGAGAAKRPVRPGPAIVRRAPAGRPRSDSAGGFGGGDSTRVADLRELERLARRPTNDARSPVRETPASAYLPPEAVGADEDFYADIEIGGDDDEETGSPLASKRVTSNVVRRGPDAPSVPMRSRAAAPSAPVATVARAGDDDDLQLVADEFEPSLDGVVPTAIAAGDDFGLDDAIAEFSAPEVTPVGTLGDRRPPAAIAAEVEPERFDDGVTGIAIDVAAATGSGPVPAVGGVPEAVPEAVPEPAFAAEREPAGTAIAADDLEPAIELSADEADEAEPSIELSASEPDPTAATGADDALGSLFAEAAAEVAVDGLSVDDEATSIGEPPLPPAVPNPFADDPGGHTRIGVPPPPLRRPGIEPIVILPIAAVGPVAAPNARTLIGALAPVLDGSGAPATPTAAPELRPPTAAERAPTVLPAAVFVDALPTLDLDRVELPEQVDPTSGFDPGADAARGILVLEQELMLIDDPALQAVLRVEAGRLYERLGDPDHARVSYDAALLADPRATAALRGLRRIARGAGDLAEATTHLDAELGIAGPLERRALALHRVDLLMAASEQDLARVAVGELLDEAQGDVRAQLAQLELAFLDGRADEVGLALERLAGVVADPSLRAALELARGHLFERAQDRTRAAASFAAAISADPTAIASHLGAIRALDGAAGAAALRGLAERSADRPLRVALALEAARRGDVAALVDAAGLAADDPTVQAAVLGAAMAGVVSGDAAFALAPIAVDPALRRAASLWASVRLPSDDPRVNGLLAAALDAEPGDDLAAATLSDRLFAAGDPGAAAAHIERRLTAGVGDELDRVRAATLWAAAGQLEPALALLPAADAIASPAAAEAWADILGVAGRAAERGALFAGVSSRSDERVDSKLWATKAATALDRAATPDDVASLHRALDAWNQVAELGVDGELVHARTMALAAGTADRDVISQTWARAQAAAESTAAASTLALARARFTQSGAAAGSPEAWGELDEILHEVPADDPRRLAATVVLASAAGRWAEVALAFEDRAAAIAERAPIEAALLRFRAAGIYLDRGADPARAASLLGALVDDQPGLGFVHDALAAARRRLGDAAPPPRVVRADSSGGDDAFARLIRDAEQVSGQGDSVGALALLAKALELRPHDPLAAEPLKRIAASVREAGPVLALALAELRLAEDSGDVRAQADAYESLARIDLDLRDDRASALISLEAAAAADGGRLVVLRELERAYGVAGRWADLAALRERQAATDPSPADRIALALDRVMLLERIESSEDELRAAYQQIVRLAPRARRALFHLETLVRRGGNSAELAALEDTIADYFADDQRTRSAFLTRGGETLSELGRLDEALERFRQANELRGGYPAALEGWRDAALRGQRWADFAEAAGKEAVLTDDDSARASLWHLAGVALMDRAQDGERAVDALRAALVADPRHTDAFIRMRLLLEEQGEHDGLATLLEARLEVETDDAERVALHRAIAELARNFLEDRERAKHHFRAIVDRSPNDLRAIAALSDIAWEQGAWGDAADMLIARARLERDPRMLRNIHYRLGMIYAERLPDPASAIRAFQRVLAHDADDDEALERLADLGIATGDWRMALGACERLVKNETVPARKVTHLHRVGRIFAEGFGDRRRAERAYQLAVDAAPDSDLALAALIKFYEDAGDAASIRVHLGMVAAAMRQRVAAGLEPGAFRVLARVARARHDAGVPGQGAVNRNAVDLARLCGADATDPVGPSPIHLGGLLRPETDELLWPAAITPELRQIFTLLGDRLAKHVGIDLRPYGVTRGDRLRAKDSAVAAAAQEVAEGLGLGEIDVFVSSRQPFAMVAEPTSPLSLVLGSAIADPNRLAGVRFAAAGALRLACAQLGILARLPEDELGVLVVAMLRLFQPDLPYLAVDNEQVVAQQQRLRRLIPSSLMNELRPYALGVHAASFDHRALARGLETAAHRAGLIAAGGAAAPLAVLVARAGVADLASGYRFPVIAEFVQFAVSEDFAALAALCTG